MCGEKGQRAEVEREHIKTARAMDPEMGMLLSTGVVLPQGRVRDKKLSPGTGR